MVAVLRAVNHRKPPKKMKIPPYRGLRRSIPCHLNTLAFSLFSLLRVSALNAATYYCDPVNGNMANPGTSGSPWSTLEAVFIANKTFVAGDVINLRTGYHGYPSIKGINSGDVTIQAQSGHTPAMSKIRAYQQASHWVLSGLTISPETAGVLDTSHYVYFDYGCSYMKVKDCLIYSASSIAGWSSTDWTYKAGTGIRSNATHTVLLNNTLRNLNTGISMRTPASNSQVTGNTIENYCGDGITGNSDDTIYEYNTVRYCYDNDTAYHRDGFQSYSYDYFPGGTAGYGVVKNVTLRGNIFVNQTDPSQPLPPGGLNNNNGIGCFDGMYDNWIVENNLIVNANLPGIVFIGARNCRIVNNTVVRNPLNPSNPFPRFETSSHKVDGGPYSGVYASNNTVRNNIAGSIKQYHATNGTVDHNLFTTDYTGYFANYAGFDFDLKSGSPALDTGSATLAPAVDIDGVARPQGAGFDIGAYEFDGGGSGGGSGGNSHSGTWSVKGVFSSTKSSKTIYQAPTGIATNSSYVATFWLKGTGSVRFLIQAGNRGATLAELRCDATSSWQKFTTPAFNTGGNTQITVQLGDSYGVAGTVYMDEVFLGVSGGANKLLNPGFESGQTSWTNGGTAVFSFGQF